MGDQHALQRFTMVNGVQLLNVLNESVAIRTISSVVKSLSFLCVVLVPDESAAHEKPKSKRRAGTHQTKKEL